MAERNLAVVADIGATNSRVGIASGERVVDSIVVDTPTDPDLFFRNIANSILHFADAYKLERVSVGLPGPVRKVNGKGYRVGPLPNVAGINEDFDLEECLVAENRRLRGFSVLPLNDTAAGAHASAHLFAKNDNEEPLTFLTLSTGVGGATIQNYKIRDGLDEYGHISIFQNGLSQYVRWEEKVSGEAIKNLYGGRRTPAEDLAGHLPQAIWNDYGKNVARGLGVLIPIEGMDQIVIGGAVGANNYHRFAPSLHVELHKIMQVLPPNLTRRPEVVGVPPNMAQEIGMIGCFYAWEEQIDN